MHSTSILLLMLLCPLTPFAFPTLALPSFLQHLSPRQYGGDTSGTWLPAGYASGGNSGCSHYGANGECGGASIDTDVSHFNDPATLLGQTDDHTATALPPTGGSTSLDSFLSEAAAATATASSDDASTTPTSNSDSDTTQTAATSSASRTMSAMASQTASAGSGQDSGASGTRALSGHCALVASIVGTILLL